MNNSPPNSDQIHVLSRGLIIDGDAILLCKTIGLPNNFYFLPGGHIEHGESAKDTLTRELREETGNNATIGDFFGCFEYSFEPDHSNICHTHEYNFIFKATIDGLDKNSTPHKVEENIDLHWVKLNELNNIDFLPSPMLSLIKKWSGDKSSSYFVSEMLI